MLVRIDCDGDWHCMAVNDITPVFGQWCQAHTESHTALYGDGLGGGRVNSHCMAVSIFLSPFLVALFVLLIFG